VSSQPVPAESVRPGGRAISWSGSPARAGPGVASFAVTYALFAALAWFAWMQTPEHSAVGVYTSVFWTLPVVASLVGVSGIVTSSRAMQASSPPAPPDPITDHELVVVVPTVGRPDVVPALERVVESLDHHLAAWFPRLRIDVVVDEGAPSEPAVGALVARCPSARLLVVPRGYTTVGRTRFKARAVDYAQVVRRESGEERDDVWVLHMDDDTGVGADTASELARFIAAQREIGVEAARVSVQVAAGSELQRIEIDRHHRARARDGLCGTNQRPVAGMQRSHRRDQHDRVPS